MHLKAEQLLHQETLFKNQIRLGLREILQQELNFYISAFNTITNGASILSGFAFTGMLLDPFDARNELSPRFLDNQERLAIETTFNVLSTFTTCLGLLTVIYSNYLGIFATRLALRGGEMAVEQAVIKTRQEYKIVLICLTACGESLYLNLTD